MYVRMFDRIEQINFLLTYFKQRASFLIMRQLSLYRSSSHVSPAEESSGKIREKVLYMNVYKKFNRFKNPNLFLDVE